MTKTSLEIFIEKVKAAWGPLNSETVENCRRLLAELAKSPLMESWLVDLIDDTSLNLNRELYRDPDQGFALLTHSENQGQFRVPHDHGSGWVIYAVLIGETEMRTYNRVVNQKGQMHLVRKDSYRMNAGDCKVYLPGDTHDTRCISSSVLMLRFTSCDLKKEDREGRITRYLEET